MWLQISMISLGVGVVTLIVTIIMFIKWNIVDVIYTVSGIKAKRMIQVYRERESSNGTRSKALTVGLDEKSGHIHTESLLMKSKATNSRGTKSEILTSGRTQAPFKISPDSIKGALTGGINTVNSKLRRTPVSSQDISEEPYEPTDLLSTNFDSNNGLRKNKGNHGSTGVVTGQESYSRDFQETDNGTTLLDERTTVLIEDEDYEPPIPKSGVFGSATTILSDIEEPDEVKEDVQTKSIETSFNELDEWASTGVITEEKQQQEEVIEDTKEEQVEEQPTQEEKVYTTVLSMEELDQLEEQDDMAQPEKPIEIDNSGVAIEEDKNLHVSSIKTSSIVVEEPENVWGFDIEEEEVKEDPNHSKTEIITEDDVPNQYRKVLREQDDTLDFHEFKVEEIVTSYDATIVAN